MQEVYCSHRALEGDEKFSLIRTISVAFGAIGGTSFRGADLTYANFSKALLKSTNFTNIWERGAQGKRRKCETLLDWVRWQDAQKLDRARVGNSILSTPAARELLVTPNGYKKSYVNVKLRTANLDSVNLEQADLTWADLSCATLRHANLKDANLSESLVLHADLTGAYLTGACLEAWNIDSQTILDQVDCQYVYLLRNQQERRPSSGNFAPGEFTKLFQEVLSTVDLIFRNGIDWKAFLAAFKQVQVENEDTLLEIQSIENKGDGVVVVRVNVPLDADKNKIHGEFNKRYKALESRHRVELKAKEREITIYREQSADMLGVITSLANRPINIQAIAMNDSTDKSQNFKTDGNFNINATNSIVNLRDISGDVTNTINQLQQSNTPDASQLAEWLKQLQSAVETAEELQPDDKAEALEQVGALAKAGQNLQDGTLKKLANTAAKIIKGTVTNLPDTAKLAEACSKLFPLITKALGLPF